MPDVALTQLARFRADAYRALSQVFLYPEPARARFLRAAASSLLRRCALLTTLAVGHRWTAFLRSLQRVPAQRIEGLQTEYTRLFGLDGLGGCAPHESSFAVQGPGQAALVIAAVEREYAAEGLAANMPSAESPDHVAVELAFMAVLCDLEAAGWSQGPVEGESPALVREQQFLRRHLGQWFPHLAKAVTVAGEGDFYALASAAADGFIHHDQDLVDLLLSRLVPAPSTEEPVRAGGR